MGWNKCFPGLMMAVCDGAGINCRRKTQVNCGTTGSVWNEIRGRKRVKKAKMVRRNMSSFIIFVQ